MPALYEAALPLQPAAGARVLVNRSRFFPGTKDEERTEKKKQTKRHKQKDRHLLDQPTVKE
jgi:cytochrome oxidase assembly protein ShyY1